MKKTYNFTNENGVFISFLDYEYEDNFDEFIKFIGRQLRVAIPEAAEGPYGRIVEFVYGGEPITASYTSDAGCFLRFPINGMISASDIVARCYGELPPA